MTAAPMPIKRPSGKPVRETSILRATLATQKGRPSDTALPARMIGKTGPQGIPGDSYRGRENSYARRGEGAGLR